MNPQQVAHLNCAVGGPLLSLAACAQPLRRIAACALLR